MLLTVSGELVIMIKNTNSRPNFYHAPNELISFIKYQCTLFDESIKINISEQEFIENIYNSDGVIERHCPRQTGGSTLLALIGFYYMLQDKNVLYYAESSYMANHFLNSVISEIDVLGFEKKIDGNTKIHLEMYGIPTRPMRIIGGNAQTRGYTKINVLLADALLPRTTEDMNKLRETLYSCVAPGGKLILNTIA